MAQLAVQQQAAPSAVDVNGALATLCGKVVEGTKALSDFVIRNRRLSRDRGLDVVAMQLQGIVDRERLNEVSKICAMGAQGKRAMPVDPGLATRLGNAERLIDDAAKEMGRSDLSSPVDAAEPGPGLGQQEGGFYWIPFAVIGAAVVGTVILLSQTKKKTESKAPELGFPRKSE